MKFIKYFKEINAKDVLTAGGKGANLGELAKIGMPVPKGFVVLAPAFERFLEETDINIETESIWKKINIEDIESIEESSEILRDLILKHEFPEQFKKEIFKAFDKLGEKYVAVRSSATAEDSKVDSWAGQLETYLNTPKKELIHNIQKCWASLYLPRALFYRVKRGLTREKVSISVVVQKMIQSEISGVCFTVNPITNDRNQMVVEAVWGLGEILVSGQVTPDTYTIEKSKLNVLDVNLSTQKNRIILKEGKNMLAPVPKSKKEKQKLSENQIKKIAKLCIKIEKHYKDPQDIEWVFKKGKFHIIQSRPITTL